MSEDTPRDEKGRLLPGAKLNPGGRAGARQRRFAKGIAADTDDALTLRKALLKLAGNEKHPKQLEAIKEALLRYLGPYSKAPLDDDELPPELTEEELYEASKNYVAAIEARRKEQPNAEQGKGKGEAGAGAAEVSAVPHGGPLQVGGTEPGD